jgi:hypothetical protein
LGEHLFEHRGAEGAALLVLRVSTGPFCEVEGLFTVLMCADCQAAGSSRWRPLKLLAGHDPGERWRTWAG